MDAFELFKRRIIEINGKEVDISEIASWAIWTSPKYGNWSSKDSIEDMRVFDNASEIRFLKSKFIFVGLNPANHRAGEEDNVGETLSEQKAVAWSNFHSGNKRKSQDYKLRKAFYRGGINHEGYEDFKGALIIDLLPNVVNTNSSEVMEETSELDWERSISDLIAIRCVLGGDATVVPMGQYAYNKLCEYREKHINDIDYPKNLTIRGIRHFSASGYSKFELAVSQLSKDPLTDPDPYMYKGY